MPIYAYVPDAGSCERCEGGFEVLQSLQDDALTACPTCGQPCHRVLTSCAIGKSSGNLLSQKNLESKGFTQYQKTDDGKYEKAFGKGPTSIQR